MMKDDMKMKDGMMKDEKKPMSMGKKKGSGGLINVTLEGSGRSCYPMLKKLNDKPY
jgi:hypothetical protein